VSYGLPRSCPFVARDQLVNMMARTKIQKVIVFLLSIAIMAVLTLVQRLYLPHRDTGKQWAVLAAWFGLCAWFLREPERRQVLVQKHGNLSSGHASASRAQTILSNAAIR
jgi:hypothetical protein